jgi:RNA polymerase sigma factor (sigma-70 family)
MIQIDSMPAAVATPAAAADAPSDAELVRRCLAEGAGAFAEIVARYQTLICSLTYNATGSLNRSEDLAQEVFVTAWKELRQLREPEKLKSWLCGIARRRAADAHRREGREPVCGAEEICEEHHPAAPGPVEEAISREEEAILWRSLEQIPATYREPLILFYREGQSVERVAVALELTEENARQRLSRGRKLLQEQVANFIEGALRVSTPGRAFTVAVIAALPAMKTSATAATIGTAAATSGAAAKGVSLLGFGSALLSVLCVVVGPVLGGLGGWFGIKLSLETAFSERERSLIRRQAGVAFSLAFLFLVVMGVVMFMIPRVPEKRMMGAMIVLAVFVLTYVAVMIVMTIHYQRMLSQVRREDAARLGPEVAARREDVWATCHYQSSWKLFGLPLMDIRTGRPAGEKLRPAKGWIAIGDVAYGALFAVGGIAIAPISFGGVSLGLLAVGGVSLGLVAHGGLALGLYGASGGVAVGYLAHGGGAAAWYAAEGGFAAARDLAVGGIAQAAHANDSTAKAAIRAMAFFRWAKWNSLHPVLFIIGYSPMLLILMQVWRAKRVMEKGAGRAGRG